MNITKQQIEAAEHGELVDIRVDNTDLVLVRKDVYQKLQAIYDDTEMLPREMYAAVDEVLDQDDDPGLESYQQYR